MEKEKKGEGRWEEREWREGKGTVREGKEEKERKGKEKKKRKGYQ